MTCAIAISPSCDDNDRGCPKFRLRWSACVGSDLRDQLLENGVGEGLVILRGDDKSPRTADHVVVIVAIEIGFERENRQSVDRNACGHCFIAGKRRRASPIIGAVTRHIDHTPWRLKRAACEEGAAVIDRAADGGAAPEQTAWRALDRGRECSG